jgi:hypothetical protein
LALLLLLLALLFFVVFLLCFGPTPLLVTGLSVFDIVGLGLGGWCLIVSRVLVSIEGGVELCPQVQFAVVFAFKFRVH